jgi:MFS transporter, ACS family, tartrate transporter
VNAPAEPVVAAASRALGPAERAIVRARRRLIPFLLVCYVVAYLDRVNIGFAAKSLGRDLGLSDAEYGLAAGLFFVGYLLLEVPSNLILARVGARRWIGRIMISWGVVSMAMTLAEGKWSLYFLRVALGAAEAGFFPGVLLYLTYWFPARERAKTVALFMLAAPISVAIGAPLSAPLLELEGTLGWHGWQWLFLIEGFPAVLLGAFSLLWLTDRPEHAAWLSLEERSALMAELAAERALRERGHESAPFRALRSWKVLMLCLVFFMNTMTTYGIFLWLPRIIEDVSGYGGMRLALLSAAPLLVALVAMVVVGAHSDRTGERKWHVVACALTGAAGLVLAAWQRHDLVGLSLGFTLCQVGQRSVSAVFWAIPPALLGGAAAAAGIALINAIGNLGGALGPSAMGWLKQATQGYAAGLLGLAGALTLLAAIVATLDLPREMPRGVAR